MCQRPDIAGTLKFINSTANKYNSSVGQHEPENKKNTSQIKIFGGHNKTVNKTSLPTFSM